MILTLKKISLWFFTTSVILLLTQCKTPEKSYIFLQGNAQGTTFSIKYFSEQEKNYQKEIEQIFNTIDASLSTYVSESLISKLNHGENTLELDPHFIRVFELSKQVYKESKGVFDPTVGLLANAYGFGPEHNIVIIDEASLNKVMQFVGFDKVSIQNNQLVKEFPETILDFNAIAQGYTVDVIGDFLESENILNYMIEIGGEVKAKGKNPQGNFWSIGIQNPALGDTNTIEKIVEIHDQSITTSGNYRKFKVDENGNKFVHTINPITGKNTPSNLLSATIVSKVNCALADAYATTLMVLGYENAKIFLSEHPELNYFLIYSDSEGGIQVDTNL